MSRLAGGALAVAVALGVAAAPAQAVDGTPEGSGLAPVLESARTSAAAGRDAEAQQSEYRAIVKDPRGDADGARFARGLADVTRVSYRSPTARGGTLRIVVDWVTWRRGDTSLQTATTLITNNADDRGWTIDVNRNRARLTTFDPETGRATRIEPEEATLAQEYGRSGTTTLEISTEWLRARRASFTTFGGAGPDQNPAFDETGSRFLRLGPRP